MPQISELKLPSCRSLFVGVEASIETGSSTLDARRKARFKLLWQASILRRMPYGRVSTTLNENCTLGTPNFRRCPRSNLLLNPARAAGARVKLPFKNGRALVFESILLSLLSQPTRAGLIHSTTSWRLWLLRSRPDQVHAVRLHGTRLSTSLMAVVTQLN